MAIYVNGVAAWLAKVDLKGRLTSKQADERVQRVLSPTDGDRAGGAKILLAPLQGA